MDLSSLFHSIVAVLSGVVDNQTDSSTADCKLVARGPYRPLWDCIVGVYCSALIGE